MIARKHIIGIICIAIVLFVACKKDPTEHLLELDLLSHGMPIVIKAPENPEIRKMDLILTKDLTVVKGDDYSVQIFESEAYTRDVGAVKSRVLGEVKSNPYFFAIVQDDPAGFIYESRVDSNYTNYGFRHVRIQADKEYVFQQGLRGKFTLDAIKMMYAAVQ
ncbi:MAG TPA: hypothetical protein VI603_13530 [Saprospiraceae bacterium]|nr:hypothetical protein [Saprospiraceae bacterium]